MCLLSCPANGCVMPCLICIQHCVWFCTVQICTHTYGSVVSCYVYFEQQALINLFLACSQICTVPSSGCLCCGRSNRCTSVGGVAGHCWAASPAWGCIKSHRCNPSTVPKPVPLTRRPKHCFWGNAYGFTFQNTSWALQDMIADIVTPEWVLLYANMYAQHIRSKLCGIHMCLITKWLAFAYAPDQNIIIVTGLVPDWYLGAVLVLEVNMLSTPGQ